MRPKKKHVLIVLPPSQLCELIGYVSHHQLRDAVQGVRIREILRVAKMCQDTAILGYVLLHGLGVDVYVGARTDDREMCRRRSVRPLRLHPGEEK